jgi:transcriptional regulator with XRE-family HTH domain
MDEIAERIKAVRETKRIKQNEIAAALGVDSSNYAKLEKRGRKLTLEQLEKIADILDISLIDLLDTDYNPDKSEREKLLESEVFELEQEIRDLNRTLKAFTSMSETIAKQNEIIIAYNKRMKEFAQEIILTFDEPTTQESVRKILQLFVDHPLTHLFDNKD